MERLYDIWDAIVSWALEHFDEPMFQLAQGILIGAAAVGAIWLMASAYRSSKEIERLENEEAER